MKTCTQLFCRQEYVVDCPHGKFCAAHWSKHLDELEAAAVAKLKDHGITVAFTRAPLPPPKGV